MMTLKCPHCGKEFTAQDEEYASILSQIKNATLAEEVHDRLEVMQQKWEADEKARQLIAKGNFDKALADKEKAISDLQSKVGSIGAQKDLEYKDQISELNLKIQKLLGDLKAAADTEARNVVDARREEREKAAEAFKEKEDKLNEELTMKQREIERLENYRLSMSTKMVGESLEEHCRNEYEDKLRELLPNAEFGKDNDPSEGTKGDFIFREKTEDGKVEFISIMFEMKNEMDTTASKHKNEDFFKKLDEDRTKKKCDYAVLVSMLEQDSTLYNRGIVDVSHKYPKMYVIRPQFFVPMITLLRNAEKRNISIRQQLQVVEQDNQDFTTFESNLRRFKDLFDGHYKNASNNFSNAIKSIDESIKDLQKVKEFLMKADTQLGQADGNLADMLDFKKISKGTTTIFEKLEEAKRINDEARKASANPDEQ